MRIKPTLIATLPLLVSALAFAEAPPLSQQETEKAVGQNVVKSVPLALDGLVAAKDKNGNDVIVSTNGRYFLKGYLQDVYTNKAVRNVKDAVDAQYLTLGNMGLNLVDIGTIPYGNPQLPLQARIMVDPYCPSCTALLKQLAENRDKVHVEIMITPISGQESILTALNLWCTYETNYNKGREVLDLLFKGQPYPTLPEQKACKGQRVLLNTMLTRTFNLKGLPAIWRVDGLAQAGTPPDLLANLNERRPIDDAEK